MFFMATVMFFMAEIPILRFLMTETAIRSGMRWQLAEQYLGQVRI